MDNVVISVVTTMLGTLFGWILAQIRLGGVKVIIKDKNERAMYHNHKKGIVSENGIGDFDSLKVDFRIIINNSSDRKIVLRDFIIVTTGKHKEVIYKEILKDMDSAKAMPYGLVGEELKSVVVEARSSMDVNAYCFISEYSLLEKIKNMQVTYLDDKLKIKKKKISNIDYLYIKAQNVQEEESNG